MERRPVGITLVAVGGFAGAVLRHGVALVVGDVAGTLAVNVVGAFALGLLVARAVSPGARLLLGTGLLSSFTTYSTFAADAVALAPAWSVAYVAATYAFGLGAGAAGLAAGRRL